MDMTKVPVMAEIREFPEYLRIRRDLSRYGTWKEFASAAGIGEATIYNLLKEDPVETNISLEVRNKVARAAYFEDWWTLVAAWRDDDLMHGLGVGIAARIGPEGKPQLIDLPVIPDELRSTDSVRAAQSFEDQVRRIMEHTVASWLLSIAVDDIYGKMITGKLAQGELARELDSGPPKPKRTSPPTSEEVNELFRQLAAARAAHREIASRGDTLLSHERQRDVGLSAQEPREADGPAPEKNKIPQKKLAPRTKRGGRRKRAG